MKKKILIVKEDFRSYWWINWILKTLIPYLNKEYEIHLLSLYKEEKWIWLSNILNKNKEINIKISYILNETFPQSKKILNEIYKLFIFARWIKKYCKMNNINTIYSHSEFPNFASILSKMFFRNNNIKLIWQIHTNPNKIWSKYQKIIKLLYNKLDILLCDSIWIKQELIKKFWLDKNKIDVLNTFIDIKRINTLSNKEIQNKKHKEILNNWKFTFINVARVVPLKNQLNIIKAFKMFKKELTSNNQNNNIQLIFLWAYDENDKYFKKIKNEIKWEKDIYFFWAVNNVFSYLKKSNIFILNSLWEWFPVAALEAMWAWLPVIFSDFKTWSLELLYKNYEKVKNKKVDVIEKADYWLLVPTWEDEKNIEQLKKAMELFYKDKKLYEKYKKLSTERSKKYDINNFIQEIKKILN